MIRIFCKTCNKKKRVRRKDLTTHCSRHLEGNLSRTNRESFSRVKKVNTKRKKIENAPQIKLSRRKN